MASPLGREFGVRKREALAEDLRLAHWAPNTCMLAQILTTAGDSALMQGKQVPEQFTRLAG